MESKLLESGIQRYSEEFARKVCDQFFQQKESISGSEILALTSIEQINLFTVRTLDRNWSEERKKLSSPFFDYGNQKVQKALTQLLNVLSKNIMVGRNDLEPLLIKAVTDTVRLIFSPYDFYFNSLLAESSDAILVGDLEKELKYIKINPGLIRGAVKQIKSESRTEVAKRDLESIFDRILEETVELPADFDPFLTEFSKIEPLDLEQIYAGTSEDEAVSLNEKYSANQETLNDQLNPDRETVAGIHEAKKIDNILANISVNQRYMFVNDLFSGDTDQFTKAFEKLEGHQNYQEAVDDLNNTYAGPNHWDLASAPYRELLEILNKRYN